MKENASYRGSGKESIRACDYGKHFDVIEFCSVERSRIKMNDAISAVEPEHMNVRCKTLNAIGTLLPAVLLMGCGGGDNNQSLELENSFGTAGAIYQGTYTNSPEQRTIAYLSNGVIRRPPDWRKSDWPVSAGTIIITEKSTFHGPSIEDVGRVAEFGLSLSIDGYDLLSDQAASEVNCEGVWDDIDVGDTSGSFLNVDEIDARNPAYNQDCTIDVEIDHPDFGWIPFTASPYDPEPHGREFFVRAIEGEYGVIMAYDGGIVRYQLASAVFAQSGPSLRFDLDFAATSLSGGDGQRVLALVYDSTLSEGTSILSEFEGVWFNQSSSGASLSLAINNSQIDGSDSNSCTYFGWIRPIEIAGLELDAPFHGVRLAIDNCDTSNPDAPVLDGDYHGLAMASENSLTIALRPGGATYRLSSAGSEIELINPKSIFFTLTR